VALVLQAFHTLLLDRYIHLRRVGRMYESQLNRSNFSTKTVAKEWLKILNQASFFSGISGEKSSWAMADLALKVVRRWKNHPRYNLKELAKSYGISSARLRLLVRTADFFPPDTRLRYLSFSHHIEAMRGDPDKALYWLKQASEKRWSSKDIRLAISGDGDPKKYSWLRCGTFWHFSHCDPRFGMEYPGRIPGQIPANAIHYFSKAGDLVVDLMAGGGSTIDAANFLERRCLAYDLHPARPDIKNHDALRSLPKEVKKVQLFFLDPPYGSISKGFYNDHPNCLSRMGESEFLDAIEKIASHCRKVLLLDGYLAILVQNIYGWQGNTPFLIANRLLLKDWKLVRRIQVPLPTQQISSSVMKWARNNRQMVNIDRDLLIFQAL